MYKNKRDFGDYSKFIKNYLSVCTINCEKNIAVMSIRERMVGCNGYALGQKFILTGEIRTKISEIDGVKYVYIVLSTKEGVDLSLASLMGVSSLKGYVLDNDVEIQFLSENNSIATRKERSYLIKDFDFAQVWQPPTRNYLDLATMIAEGDLSLINAKVTYLGVVVKPFKAKKRGVSRGEEFDIGFQRVIENHLWSLECI